jgi:exopolysaccharide biosynthesis polyprenyl glycosylphosphotransferase
MYLALYMVFGRLFSAMNIGETTTTDLFLSHSLTMLFTNAFIYLVLCLITLRILPLWPILSMQGIEMAVAALFLYLGNHFIKSQYPPIRLIAIRGDSHDELIGKLNNVKDLSLHIVKTVDLKKINYKKIDELLKDVDGVVTLDVHHENKKKIFKACYERELLVFDVPSITDMLLASSSILHMTDTPILKTNDFGPSQVERIFKRLIDIFGSLFLLILTSPIMLLIAIAIKIEDRGDIFYKQVRLTTKGRKFKIIKFRSMIMNAEKHTGVTLAKENDDRITKVGRFIRKIRMDELPQLVNILRGEMSFVGPRPERPEIAEQYYEKMPDFKLRLQVKAGLTGYAQIYGRYNSDPYEKLEFDLFYINQMSLTTDFQLCFATLLTFFSKDNTKGIEEGQTTALSDEANEPIIDYEEVNGGDSPEADE